jgi:hypothetical protein
MIYDKKNIYLFSYEKVFVFDTRRNIIPPKMNKKIQAKFNHLITDSIDASKKWPGFDPNYGRFFAKNNHLCVIKDNSVYSCWGSGSKRYATDEPIGEPESEIPDEPDVDNGDTGAMISADENNGKIARIKGQKVCNLIIEDGKLFFIGECVSVTDEKHNYPPNIIAAIKAKGGNWYFIRKDGKYCKRDESDYKTVSEKNFLQLKIFHKLVLS